MSTRFAVWAGDDILLDTFDTFDRAITYACIEIEHPLGWKALHVGEVTFDDFGIQRGEDLCLVERRTA